MALKHGQIEEVGTHEELMFTKGYYHSLVTKQLKGGDGDEGSEDDKKAHDDESLLLDNRGTCCTSQNEMY